MKKSRWIAMMAAANLFVLSLAATAYSADIEIIGTDESEVQTEAPAIAVQPEASLQAQDAVSAVSSENGAADAAGFRGTGAANTDAGTCGEAYSFQGRVFRS